MSCNTLLKLAFASCIPVTPPVINNTINVIAHTIGGDSSMFPRHTVLNHENTLIPVGIATAVVAITKYLRLEKDIPTVYI